MKKNNLKRFLASLLAVLMLASVTGVAPGVFAKGADNAATYEAGEYQAPKYHNGTAIIKKDSSDAEVRALVTKAIVENYNDVDPATLSGMEWEYYCTGDRILGLLGSKTKTDWVSINGHTDVTAKATYKFPSLADNDYISYQVRLKGATVEYTLTKADAAQSRITASNEVKDIVIPYTSGTEYDVSALNESIFNAYVTSTTPAGLTYDKLSYTGTVAEGQQTITISYAGDEDHYGANAPVTVNFVDNRIEAFSAKEKPENISAGFVKNDANAALTVINIREALVNKLSDLDLSEVTVECTSSIDVTGAFYSQLSDDGLNALLTTDTKANIKLTYAGSESYKPFTAEFKGIKFADNRIASSIAVKEGASITFNMSAENMKEQIFNNVIDWDSDSTKLPAKDTLSIADFKFEIGLKDIADKDGYPNLDAGNGQTIKISFVGNSEFKPCNDVEATIDVAKANVKVTMKSFSTAHAGNADELTQEALNVQLDPNDPKLDVYMIFAGINTNLDTSVNLVLTKDQQDVIDTISNAQKEIFDLATTLFPNLDIDKTTLKEKLESGITIGQFKEYLNSFIAAIDKVPGAEGILNRFGVSIDTIKTMATIFDKLTQFSDDTVIAVGAPKHAGLYTATAVAVNKNYNTGVASGTVMILMNVKGMKIQLNSNFSKKMTVAQAEDLAKDPAGVATLLCGTKPVGNPNLHYLYTGVQSNLKPYSSTTDFPTAPGRYVVTVVTLGGDYLAAPVTRSFQITK